MVTIVSRARGVIWFTGLVLVTVGFEGCKDLSAKRNLDPYEMKDVFSRFPMAKVIPLDNGKAWGLMYADTRGILHLNRVTDKGWRKEWELSSLDSKIRRFFFADIEDDGEYEIIVATVNGRLLIYSAGDYINLWENLEDNFTSIDAIDICDIDSDIQLEFVFIADKRLYIYDGISKSRQWLSNEELEATELIIEDVDDDEQFEIILNTGIVLDTKFYTIELELERPFGDRIIVFDMNNDGFQEVIGEFSDYSLRIFDVYSRREVWY